MLVMLINLRITVTEQSIFRVGVVIKLCSSDSVSSPSMHQP